jgi:hypothetical protein
VRATPLNNKNQSAELSFVTKNADSSWVCMQWSAVLNADSTHLWFIEPEITVRPLGPAVSHWNFSLFEYYQPICPDPFFSSFGTVVPALDDGWWWVWSCRWNDWQGKPKRSEETCCSAVLSTTNHTWPEPGSKPDRRLGGWRQTVWDMARPLVLLGFPTKTLYIFLILPIRVTFCAVFL